MAKRARSSEDLNLDGGSENNAAYTSTASDVQLAVHMALEAQPSPRGTSSSPRSTTPPTLSLAAMSFDERKRLRAARFGIPVHVEEEKAVAPTLPKVAASSSSWTASASSASAPSSSSSASSSSSSSPHTGSSQQRRQQHQHQQHNHKNDVIVAVAAGSTWRGGHTSSQERGGGPQKQEQQPQPQWQSSAAGGANASHDSRISSTRLGASTPWFDLVAGSGSVAEEEAVASSSSSPSRQGKDRGLPGGIAAMEASAAIGVPVSINTTAHSKVAEGVSSSTWDALPPRERGRGRKGGGGGGAMVEEVGVK